MKINVVGAGPAGLYLSLLAKKLDPRHEIHVYERDPAHNTYGWGIVFSQGTMASLRGADFESYLNITEAAESWQNVDVILNGESVSISGNDFSGIQRITFLNILQERALELGVNLHFEHNIEELDDLADADLLIGADGLKSFIRSANEEAFITTAEERKNYYIWLGTSKSFQSLTMMFKQHQDGVYIAHAYRFNSEMSTFIVECDPETWKSGGFEKRGEDATCSYLAQVFEEELEGASLISNASTWNHFILVKNRRWYKDNLVLLGDALHSAHFSIGSGTKLAVEDAVALVGSMAEEEDVPSILKRFEKRRKPRVDAFQDAALDSLIWLEDVRPEMGLDPIAFAYRLMTRSNRIGHRRLKDQDPVFLNAYEEWRWRNEGPVHSEFLDLFEKKAYAHVGTLLVDGQPHVTPIWADYDGECILLNSAKGRQKDLNMDRRRRVSVEISDPEDPNRYISVIGEVIEITEEGAEEHLNKLSKRYLERDRYPPSWRFPGEIRRIYKIKPHRVIHWDPFGGF